MPLRQVSGANSELQKSPAAAPSTANKPQNHHPTQLCPCLGARRRHYTSVGGHGHTVQDDGGEQDYAGGKGGYAGRRRSSPPYQQQHPARRPPLPPGSASAAAVSYSNTTVRACVVIGRW